MTRAGDTFEIINELGLHARAATRLAQLASRFASDVWVEKDGQLVNAKSVMGMLLLCGQRGSHITVSAEGSDAVEAVRALGALVRSRFGEER